MNMSSEWSLNWIFQQGEQLLGSGAAAFAGQGESCHADICCFILHPDNPALCNIAHSGPYGVGWSVPEMLTVDSDVHTKKGDKTQSRKHGRYLSEALVSV